MTNFHQLLIINEIETNLEPITHCVGLFRWNQTFIYARRHLVLFINSPPTISAKKKRRHQQTVVVSTINFVLALLQSIIEALLKTKDQVCNIPCDGNAILKFICMYVRRLWIYWMQLCLENYEDCSNFLGFSFSVFQRREC